MSEVNMFNLAQEREDNRAIELKEFLEAQKKEYEMYQPFNKVVQALLGNIAKLDPLGPDKDQKGTAITKNKNNFKLSLATKVNVVCIGATEYALSTGDEDLKLAVRFRATDIIKAKDGNVTGIVTTITDALTPLLNVPEFKEYQITAEMLTALTKDAEDFSNTRGKAAVVDIDSSLANDQINQIFKDIRSNIASLRRLLVHFNLSNPDFVKGFNKAAAVNYTGIHHNGIEGFVTNPSTGAVIEGATITGEGKKKIAVTDSKGYYKLIKLKATDMKITVAAPGYEPQVIDVKIVRGKIIALNASLQANVMALPEIQTA